MSLNANEPKSGSGLVERLRDEADLCANEGAEDIALLLNEAASALESASTERLPPLPRPSYSLDIGDGWMTPTQGYTAEQMRDYAAASARNTQAWIRAKGLAELASGGTATVMGERSEEFSVPLSAADTQWELVGYFMEDNGRWLKMDNAYSTEPDAVPLYRKRVGAVAGGA